MAHLVEGDWKKFTFKMLTASDFPVLSKHLRSNFYVDEPLGQIVGNSETKGEDFDNFVAGLMDQNLSFAVYDKETGKMAGARISYRHSKDFDYTAFTFNSVEMQIMLPFFLTLEAETNVFEKYGVDEYADLLIASVDRDYRCQGLATEMYRRALAFLKESGFSVAKSIFTSPYTRIAAKKFNFEELAKRYFRQLQDLDGRLMRPDAGDDEVAVIMAVKL